MEPGAKAPGFFVGCVALHAEQTGGEISVGKAAIVGGNGRLTCSCQSRKAGAEHIHVLASFLARPPCLSTKSGYSHLSYFACALSAYTIPAESLLKDGKRKMASEAGRYDKSADALVLAEDLRDALGRFVRSVKVQANTPTTSQSETLSLLERTGPLSVAELAERRKVKHQSMRLVAGQLESEGLISRSPNPTDGRSQLLSITQEGLTKLSRSREARTSQIAKVIEERLTDEERRTLAAAILVIDRLC